MQVKSRGLREHETPPVCRRWCHAPGVQRGNRLRPSQKPVTMLLPLMETFSKAGGLVLDPFAGSGSTLLAAEMLGRSYLGIEIDAGYHALARRRLPRQHPNVALNLSDLNAGASHNRTPNAPQTPKTQAFRMDLHMHPNHAMATKLRLTFLTSVALIALGAEQDFNWRGTVLNGQSLEIKGVNGGIKAVAGAGNEVQVHAVKRGRKNNPEEVKIEVLQHPRGVTLCAVYPSQGDKPNECKPGEAGRNNVRNNDVNVNWEVHIPPGVKLLAKTVNGGIEARDLGGDVIAKTVNGRLDISAKGSVEANTVNGGINAAMGQTDWNGEHKFSTVNGGITIEMPAAASTEIKASTVNGRIESDLPLMVQGKISNRSLQATLGNGGRALNLSTVNGSIHLKRR